MTVADMISKITGDLDRGSSYTERIRQAIQTAVQFYKSRRFAFNQVVTTHEQAGEFGSLSAVLQLDDLRLYTNADREPMRRRPWQDLADRAVSPAQDTGEPIYYATQARQLRLYPLPDQTYSFQMTALADLTYGQSFSDSLSTAWMTEAEELIRLHAMGEILDLYRGGEDDMARSSRLSQREQVVYNELKRAQSKEQGTGSVRPFL